jgi:hypothetical protein
LRGPFQRASSEVTSCFFALKEAKQAVKKVRSLLLLLLLPPPPPPPPLLLLPLLLLPLLLLLLLLLLLCRRLERRSPGRVSQQHARARFTTACQFTANSQPFFAAAAASS